MNVHPTLPRNYTGLSKHSKLLNRLVELQSIPELASYLNTLIDAEVTIYALEFSTNIVVHPESN